MSFAVDDKLNKKLIELVQANPQLYQKGVRKAPYQSLLHEKELWASIATSLGIPLNECLGRWRALKVRFIRELRKPENPELSVEKNSTWPLLEKMRFIEQHIKGGKAFRALSTPKKDHKDVKQTRTNDDEQLQEAMEDQAISSSYMLDQSKEMESTPTPVAGMSTLDTDIKNMEPIDKRIVVLLHGLDELNRAKAEKRIVQFLCKCQLKSLNNESIDEVAL